MSTTTKKYAEQAEKALDQIAFDLEATALEPDLELQQAIGRASHAANELWHKIAGMRAEQWKKGATK